MTTFRKLPRSRPKMKVIEISKRRLLLKKLIISFNVLGLKWSKIDLYNLEALEMAIQLGQVGILVST